jgi:hypothetical protein
MNIEIQLQQLLKNKNEEEDHCTRVKMHVSNGLTSVRHCTRVKRFDTCTTLYTCQTARDKLK